MRPPSQSLRLLTILLMTAYSSPGQPSKPHYPDHTRLLYYLDASGRERPVATAADWNHRRADILAGMQAVMGPLPGPERKVAPEVQVQEEIRDGDLLRRKITFAPETGDRVPAFLFLPRGARPAAAVLCLHQTTPIGKAEPAGLGGRANLHYARELAERGYVTLAPDYPNFGDYHFDPYAHGYASGTMKAIWNNVRAVDLLQSLPEVDPERIGCIGHSLGGHNALFTAAFEPRLRAVVSSCGFTAFARYYGGDLTAWTGPTYMPRIREIARPDRMPFDFHEVVAALAPRAFFACAPLRDANFDNRGVREVIESASAVYRLLGVPERLAAEYPDAEHDFPSRERELAYRFLNRFLTGKGSGPRPVNMSAPD